MFAAAVIVAVIGYWLFMIVERTGVATRTMRAAVIAKRYEAAHRTYVTQIINGRSVVVPQDVADAYVVDVATPAGRASGIVPTDLYSRLLIGDSVTVAVRSGRLSGRLDVTSVSR
jgi:hypothetical protein